MSIIFASKYLDSTLTKSHAARLLVSTSLPSISRLIYSSGLSTNNSLSDSAKFSEVSNANPLYFYTGIVTSKFHVRNNNFFTDITKSCRIFEQMSILRPIGYCGQKLQCIRH